MKNAGLFAALLLVLSSTATVHAQPRSEMMKIDGEYTMIDGQPFIMKQDGVPREFKEANYEQYQEILRQLIQNLEYSFRPSAEYNIKLLSTDSGYMTESLYRESESDGIVMGYISQAKVDDIWSYLYDVTQTGSRKKTPAPQAETQEIEPEPEYIEPIRQTLPIEEEIIEQIQNTPDREGFKKDIIKP